MFKWIGLGLAAGTVTGMAVGGATAGIVGGIVVGMAGAFVGGWLHYGLGITDPIPSATPGLLASASSSIDVRRKSR